MKKLYFFLIFLLIVSFAKAQNYAFKHLQVEDGLSHNSVICMLQDSKGFMWFGTKDGLNRYDGYSFKLFQHIPGNNKSIGSNFIRCLYEFNDYLWVGTDTGLFKYDEKTESFSVIESSRNLPILDVESNVNGNLWFIAAGSLFKIDAYKAASRSEKYDQFYANYISHTRKGDVYVAAPQDIFKYIPENNSFQKLNINLPPEVIITAMATPNDNTILLGTKNNGAFIYNIKTKTVIPVLPEKENPLFVRDFLFKAPVPS